MRAIVVTEAGAAPVLVTARATPRPGPAEILVEVRVSSVNPVDRSVAAGRFAAFARYEWPAGLGRDFAGVVAAVGEEVTAFSPGDEVFGYVPPVLDGVVGRGAWADRVVVRLGEPIAPRPAGLRWAEAGTAGVAGLTALAATDGVAATAGERILVVGATGGVGSVVVQLLAAAGATVIAPALAEDAPYLRALGAAVILDRALGLPEALRAAGEPADLDALVDLVSADPDAHAARRAVLAPGARVATVLPSAGAATYVEADPAAIGRLAALLGDGTVRISVHATSELADAGGALSTLTTQHIRGKIAIAVDKET